MPVRHPFRGRACFARICAAWDERFRSGLVCHRFLHHWYLLFLLSRLAVCPSISWQSSCGAQCFNLCRWQLALRFGLSGNCKRSRFKSGESPVIYQPQLRLQDSILVTYACVKASLPRRTQRQLWEGSLGCRLGAAWFLESLVARCLRN